MNITGQWLNCFLVPGVVVMGAQWGDEGKGKAVDVFSSHADYVVRYQGGANAGHTLYVHGKKKILHLIPSGVFSKNTVCVIATGVALDIETLAKEIKLLKESGLHLSAGKLLVSHSATLLLSYHRLLDQVREKAANGTKNQIGTTGRGVGPAFEDRASRRALLFGDIFQDKETLKRKLQSNLREKNFLLEKYYHHPPVDIQKTLHQILTLREELKAYLVPDTSGVIDRALKNRKKVLFEGAQGSLLDIFHGTYPYVTSSHTLSSAALTGTGVGPASVQKVIAITKSYTTRVGQGPFPTECKEVCGGQHLQQKGEEWGATTGRKRRCGWLDLMALRYAVRLSGVTHLALMKLDVLSGLKDIPVCVAYRLKGRVIKDYPVQVCDLSLCEPVYQKLKGWEEDISRVREFKDLPQAAQNYVKFVQKQLAVQVDVISVGSLREQTLFLNPLF